jgi:hypothetical protein
VTDKAIIERLPRNDIQAQVLVRASDGKNPRGGRQSQLGQGRNGVEDIGGKGIVSTPGSEPNGHASEIAGQCHSAEVFEEYGEILIGRGVEFSVTNQEAEYISQVGTGGATPREAASL